MNCMRGDSDTEAEEKLLNAVTNRGLREVRRLLAEGVSPNICDAKGNTPLILAAGGGARDIVRELIIAGADVNCRDEQGMTALMHAPRRDDKASVTVRMLLEAGTELDRQDNRGYYPRHYVMMAALWGWEESACATVAAVPPYSLSDILGKGKS
jgi:ankyrin repeat protein